MTSIEYNASGRVSDHWTTVIRTYSGPTYALMCFNVAISLHLLPAATVAKGSFKARCSTA